MWSPNEYLSSRPARRVRSLARVSPLHPRLLAGSRRPRLRLNHGRQTAVDLRRTLRERARDPGRVRRVCVRLEARRDAAEQQRAKAAREGSDGGQTVAQLRVRVRELLDERAYSLGSSRVISGRRAARTGGGRGTRAALHTGERWRHQPRRIALRRLLRFDSLAARIGELVPEAAERGERLGVEVAAPRKRRQQARHLVEDGRLV